VTPYQQLEKPLISVSGFFSLNAQLLIRKPRQLLPPAPARCAALTQALGERILDISHVRRRFGYRRILDLLRSEFPGVKHKRVYRFYRDANLAVRRRKNAKRPPCERVPLQLAEKVNDVWSLNEQLFLSLP
jgi:putative transposase